jgi:hypothetical protein
MRLVRASEWGLAIVGLGVCIAAAVLFWEHDTLLGGPNLYLLEILLLGVFVIVATSGQDNVEAWGFLPWIGPFLVPAFVGFLLSGFLAVRRLRRRYSWHVVAFIVSGVIQGSIMWSIFRGRQ